MRPPVSGDGGAGRSVDAAAAAGRVRAGAGGGERRNTLGDSGRTCCC